MYVYSRGGPHTALAPRPSLIYCASPLINPLSSHTSNEVQDFTYGDVIEVTGFHGKLSQVSKS
jgi:hypothetical protein